MAEILHINAINRCIDEELSKATAKYGPLHFDIIVVENSRGDTTSDIASCWFALRYLNLTGSRVKAILKASPSGGIAAPAIRLVISLAFSRGLCHRCAPPDRPISLVKHGLAEPALRWASPCLSRSRFGILLVAMPRYGFTAFGDHPSGFGQGRMKDVALLFCHGSGPFGR